MSGGGGGGETRTVTETRIPPELVPIVRAQSRIGLGGLQDLQTQLSGAGADELIAGLDPLQEEGFESAQAAVSEGGIIPTVTQDLLNTAQGNFLFGGEGFDQAVQASIDAAQPAILSSFGRAGGTPGGLAQTAIQQVASNAFANLFNQERQRQQAARAALPQLALLPSDVLGGIGAERRALAQQELTAPISANEALIAAAGGGVPLSSLLGQAQTSQGPQRSRLAGGLLGGLGGAASGAALGSAIPGLGTGIGAGIGGGLGLLAGLF